MPELRGKFVRASESTKPCGNRIDYCTAQRCVAALTLSVRPNLDPDARVRAMAGTTLFRAWPEAALRRLAQATRVSIHRPGGLVVDSNHPCHALTLVVEGTVQACVTAKAGRRITFKVGGPGGVYGLIPMLDGGEMPSDLVAVSSVVALAISYAAIRAELNRTPALWESLASEMGVRARGYTDQMRRFLFDGPRVRMAGLLVSFAHGGVQSKDGAIALPLQLSQERLAEMLGISRQWATGLVREMCDSGLIGWRYGRVTVFDIDGLRAIARESINPYA